MRYMSKEAADCYRKSIVATGNFWLLQEGAGCYRKLLVATVSCWLFLYGYFYDNHMRHRKLQDATKSCRKVQDALKRK